MNNKEREILESLNSLISQILKGEKTKFEYLSVDSSDNESINELRDNVYNLANQYNDNYLFIKSLSNGDLDVFPPLKNSFSNPFKQLHSTLLHLTWQIKQISEGDYDQVVSYSGDFSKAFNKMILNLREKQKIEELNKSMLKELKELNNMKDRFFTTVSHDLKSPFSGILGMSEILIDELKNSRNDNAIQYAELIRRSTEQVYQLLTNLLEWSKSQMNTTAVKFIPISVNKVVSSVIEEISEMANSKSVKFFYHQDEENLQVMADYNMLRTVLRNMMSNAVKFSFHGGKVDISAKSESEKILISISDTGVGIDDKSILKLFRLDSNYSTKGTEKEPGTGLGLIICKEFIDKMNGNVSVRSEINKGTEFIISLPNISV